MTKGIVSLGERMHWYVSRLRLMGLPEVIWRLKQLLQNKAAEWDVGLARKVPVAMWPAFHEEICILAGLDVYANDTECLMHAADSLLTGHWRIFAMHEANLGFPPEWNRDPRTGTLAPIKLGTSINYRNEALVGDIKYLWEPSRHIELVTLCLAFRSSGDDRYLQGAWALLDSWLEQCPYPIGVHWTSALELAIRLLNWSLAWQVLGGRKAACWNDEAAQRRQSRWMDAIYQHQHFITGHLSKHSSANNHLFGEYLGLFAASTTWPCWPESRDWMALARDGLEAEAIKQNYCDGVNKEQAIYYHHEVMDMMIFAMRYSAAAGNPMTGDFSTRLERMADFLASVMDVNGNVPMIGDADDAQLARLDYSPSSSVYPALLATCGLMLNRPDLLAKAGSVDPKTVRLLNQQPGDACQPRPPKMNFDAGGYWLLGSGWNTAKEVRMVIDAGELGYLSIAAHGHADALAMTLSVGGTEILIDPGTYAYHTQKKWRDHFRSTAAHNTVEIDGADQSVISGNFMWMQRANARLITHSIAPELQVFEAEHDGYCRLADPVIHRRQVKYLPGEQRLIITDRLICQRNHHVKLHWHLHECLQPSWSEHELQIVTAESQITMRMDAPGFALAILAGQDDPPQGWVARHFDEKVPGKVACWSGTIERETSLITIIQISQQAVA